MNQRPLTDAEIIASAIIVDEKDLEAPAHLRALARAMSGLRAHGAGPYLVRWPSGIAILVDSDPSNRQRWHKHLVTSYRQAAQGKSGIVTMEGL